MLSEEHRDYLTIAHNRKFILAFLERSIENARRESTRLAVLYIDVDHMKKFNDIWSLPAGDSLLIALAQIAHSVTHECGKVGRIGGDEFLLVLPGATREGAFTTGARIRAEFALVQIRNESLQATSPPQTVTQGVACFPDDAATALKLLTCADNANHEGKNRGRNCIVSLPTLL